MRTFFLRRKVWRLVGCIKSSVLATLVSCCLLVYIAWEASTLIGDSLTPPPPLDQDLSHFRRNRSLGHYLDNIQLLVEPSKVPCEGNAEVPVFVVVTSTPSRFENREAIRRTWGAFMPTYFLIGVDKHHNGVTTDNYIEAKQYSDLVIYDVREHYQNLTLKTGLILQWALARCPNTKFLYKADDDMMVNPWVFQEVLRERGKDAQVLGYVHNNSGIHRDQHNKWYLPRWLFPEEMIPQYATGPGYLIGGQYIGRVLETAKKVPMHNIEDVYFTYNVAKKTLGYNLTHEWRLFPYRPWPSWLPIGCAYWTYASIHSLKANEILWVWSYLRTIAEEYSKGKKVCGFYNHYIKHLIKTYPW